MSHTGMWGIIHVFASWGGGKWEWGKGALVGSFFTPPAPEAAVIIGWLFDTHTMNKPVSISISKVWNVFFVYCYMWISSDLKIHESFIFLCWNDMQMQNHGLTLKLAKCKKLFTQAFIWNPTNLKSNAFLSWSSLTN